MGIYIYRITKHVSNCSDGKPAFIAIYAYKPSYSGWDSDKFNRKWHFKSGAQASDNMAAAGKFKDCRIVLGSINDAGQIEVMPGEAVWINKFNCGSFADCDLSEAPLPKLEGVKS